MEMADMFWVATGTAIHHRLFSLPEAARKASNPRYVDSNEAGCYGYAYIPIHQIRITLTGVSTLRLGRHGQNLSI